MIATFLSKYTRFVLHHRYTVLAVLGLATTALAWAATTLHVEITPRRADIGYGQIVLWLGTADLVPRQIEFSESSADLLGEDGRRNTPKRRMRQNDLRLVGAIPVAHAVMVESPAAATKTAIEIGDVKLNQGSVPRVALSKGPPIAPRISRHRQSQSASRLSRHWRSTRLVDRTVPRKRRADPASAL